MSQGPYDIEAPRNVQHFVDGVFVDSLDGATFESVSPIDNAVIALVAEGGPQTPIGRWTRPGAPSTRDHGRA